MTSAITVRYSVIQCREAEAEAGLSCVPNGISGHVDTILERLLILEGHLVSVNLLMKWAYLRITTVQLKAVILGICFES